MGAIRIKGGRLVDPFKVTTEDVAATDFIHALSCINRYTGQSLYPYSVAQHTYVLGMHVPDKLRKAALIHDYAEVYFNDLASPVKATMPDYECAEQDALDIIAWYYKVEWSDLREVSQYDKRIYKDETAVLFDGPRNVGMGDERVPLGIDTWHFRERQWRNVRHDLRLYTERVFNV